MNDGSSFYSCTPDDQDEVEDMTYSRSSYTLYSEPRCAGDQLH